MKKHECFYFLFLIVFAGVASIASADGIDLFLQDLSFVEKGQGGSNAYVQVQARLEKGGLCANDRARLVLRQVELLTRNPKAYHWKAWDKARYAKAFSLLEKEIIAPREVDPEVKRRGLWQMIDGWFYDKSLNLYDYPMARLCEMALRDPAVEQNAEVSGEIYLYLADRHRSRGCKDLAFECCREASGRLKDPVRKAQALFQAALMARDLRDLAASSRCLEEIGTIEGLPYALTKQAILWRAENAIYPDQHNWVPTKEGLAEARKYIAEALDDRSPLLGTKMAGKVLVALVQAEAKAGNRAEAVKTGTALLDEKGKLDHCAQANLAVFIADTLHAMGDYKGAVKFYERGIDGSDIGPKNVHKRIAISARAGKDFLRAMQAYSEAIKYCDPEVDRADITHLTDLIRQMNKTVRKGTSSLDAEKMFLDTDEDIDGLTLDEE